ncbi:MAG: ASCH domain-containing protein [Maricaulaceae bacterium]
MTPEQARAWAAFLANTGRTGSPFEIDCFGDTPALADELGALVLAGTKQATCALVREYTARGLDPPQPGALSLILYGRAAPLCVVETTHVAIAPVSAVDAAFAWDEGEGDRTLASWLADHRAYFERVAARLNFTYTDAEPAVFERFQVVWRAAP